MTLVYHRHDGSQVDIHDIDDIDQARLLLDELDGEILSLKMQLAGGFKGKAPDWRVKAEGALRARGFLRPRMQQHIADLRRAERGREEVARQAAFSRGTDAKRAAFVKAAKDCLSVDKFREIWSRAEAIDPSAFKEEAA